MKEFATGGMYIHMEVCILHIKCHKPGSRREAENNLGEGDYAEAELADEVVQSPEV